MANSYSNINLMYILWRKKPIILSFFLNLFNKLAFANCVAKLKLFASISATDAKPRNVTSNIYNDRYDK